MQTNINTLATLASKSKTGINILPTTRAAQMVCLSILTAFTLIGQYVMLGETGLSKQILGESFEWIELTLWGFRALVEVFIVVYISMTKTDDPHQAAVLNRFKVGLILLVILTVGPVWLSRQYPNKSMDGILSVYGTYAWSFAIAGISATMLWGVATAYKYQPTNPGSMMLDIADYEQMVKIVATANKQSTEATIKVETMLIERDKALAELQGMRSAVDVLRFLPATAQVQIVAMFASSRPTPETLAEVFKLSPSTVRGVYAKLEQ